MSDVELIKKMYDDYFVRGDVDAVIAILDPAIEWAEPDLEYLPYTGLTKGRDNVAKNVFPKIPETYERLLFSPEVFIDGGDTVTVMGTCFAKGANNPEEQFPFAHVVKLRDGLIVRFDHFVDTNKIARTLGGPVKRSS
ncbi:nuclear transport factor 2 family protein [Streptomyces sp. NBC_01643]|uniref:nuclear transport factor 2 family protein n=1 Tax=Streptomyces sp. NBC_01643 TaxID=2975906 RepID=UPI002F906E2F|nr:nuclear transport factor 2 family protein [Streptomyces sp. NBC_01643]